MNIQLNRTRDTDREFRRNYGNEWKAKKKEAQKRREDQARIDEMRQVGPLAFVEAPRRDIVIIKVINSYTVKDPLFGLGFKYSKYDQSWFRCVSGNEIKPTLDSLRELGVTIEDVLFEDKKSA